MKFLFNLLLCIFVINSCGLFSNEDEESSSSSSEASSESSSSVGPGGGTVTYSLNGSLEAIENCDAVQDFIRSRALDSLYEDYERYQNNIKNFVFEDSDILETAVGLPESAATTKSVSSDSSNSVVDYTQTNTQTQFVAEPDIIKKYC